MSWQYCKQMQFGWGDGVVQCNKISSKMGGCAGCMGPNRRASNYQVNRLTENSPIKNRVSVSELPASRNKERIIEELNQTKRRYEQTNLISTLINSPILDKTQHFPSRISRADSPEAFVPSRESLEEIHRSSGILKLKRTESSNIVDRKPETSLFFDQNRERLSSDKPLFVSEFRGDYERSNSKVLAEIRLNKSEMGLGLKKKGLSNIPELADEDVKTPAYVKQIRKLNGEDVLPSALESLPRELDPAPRLNLQCYLKDLA